MEQIEPFYMVYGLDQGAPTARHHTYELALNEAKRLARNNPGIKFYVLGTMGCAERIDVAFRAIDCTPLPF